jgi:apolipoprotein N-acyltransferase
MVKLFLVLLLGSSTALAFPPYNYPLTIFISMIIFLWGLDQNKLSKNSLLYGYIFYIGASYSFIASWFSYYFRIQLKVNHLVSYLLTLSLCLYVALFYAVISWLYQRYKTSSPWFNLVLFFPSFWTISELIRGAFFPRSWYALGYTQVNNSWFRGVFPLLGVYGVSFLILSLCGWLVYCLIHLKPRRWLLCSSGIALIVGVLQLTRHIDYTYKSGPDIKVALLQPSIFSSKNYSMLTRNDLEQAVEHLVKHTHAAIMVVPETVFGTTYEYMNPGYLQRLVSTAQANGAELIISTTLHAGKNHLISVNVLGNNLNLPIYIKHNLVPFGEYNPLKNTFLASLLGETANLITEYTPGPPLQQPALIKGQRFAFNICYENSINDFVARNAVDATILLNQSDLSWYGRSVMKDAFFQFSQARALENQRYFLQDGNTGDTAIINQYGQVESKIAPYISGVAIGEVKGFSGATPFALLGNLPVWLLSISIIGIALWRKQKAINPN